MAYKRSILTRVSRLRQGSHPSLSYILHSDYKKTQSRNPDTSRLQNCNFLQRGCHSSMNGASPRINSLLLQQVSYFSPVLGSICLSRNYSKATGGGSDKVEHLQDATEMLTENSVETVSQSPDIATAISQVRGFSEVAIDDADSYAPVEALQYINDAVHSFIGLNWWSSIALTTLMIGGATVPLLVNQLKASSKFAAMNWPMNISMHEEVLEKIERAGLRLEHDLYNFAIASLCKLHQIAAAKSLFEHMICSGKKPSSSTCEALFSGLSEKRELVEMKKLYMEMSAKGIQLSTGSYKILIKRLTRGGRMGDLEMTSQVCRDCIGKEWFSEFFKSHTLLMNTLVNNLVMRGKYDELEKLVVMLENHGLHLNIHSYSMMIDFLCDEDKSAKAMEFFERASSRGMKFQSNTYEDLFMALGNEKKLGIIKRLYRDTCEKNIPLYSDCYETLIKKLAQNGDLDTALCVWKEYCSNKSPSTSLVQLYSEEIHTLIKHQGDYIGGTTLFKAMVLKDMIPCVWALEDLMEYCWDTYSNEIEETLDLIRDKVFCKGEYCDEDVKDWL